MDLTRVGCNLDVMNVLQEQFGGILDVGDPQLDDTMSFARDVGERLSYILRTSGEQNVSATILPREVFS